MNLIGISAFRGASAACLLREGRIIAAAREDWFTRQAQDDEFPRNAIAYCLRAGKIGPGDVSSAIVAGDVREWPKPGQGRYRDSAGPGAPSFRERIGGWLGGRRRGWIEEELAPSVEIHSVGIMDALAAAAFYPSPFSEAAVLAVTNDAVRIASGKGDTLEPLELAGVEIDSAARRLASKIVSLAGEAREKTGHRALAVAGPAAAHPAVVNALLGSKLFDRVWVHPASALGAEVVGAALWYWHAQAGGARKVSRAQGPGYSSHQIRTFLRSRGISAEDLAREEMIAKTAELLAAGSTLGWFEGRLDFGDPTIASRSVLSSPKRAEPPLAPDEIVVVSRERVRDVFDLERDDLPRFASAALKESWTAVSSPEVPLFVVERDEERLLHDLLLAFEQRTGCPALLARPFCRPGEPVACTPGDAYEDSLALAVETMVMGPYIFQSPVAKPGRESAPLTGGGRSSEIV